MSLADKSSADKWSLVSFPLASPLHLEPTCCSQVLQSTCFWKISSQAGTLSYLLLPTNHIIEVPKNMPLFWKRGRYVLFNAEEIESWENMTTRSGLTHRHSGGGIWHDQLWLVKTVQQTVSTRIRFYSFLHSGRGYKLIGWKLDVGWHIAHRHTVVVE